MTMKASVSSRAFAERLKIKAPERILPLTYILGYKYRGTQLLKRIKNIVVLHSGHMRRSLTELAADVLDRMGLISGVN